MANIVSGVLFIAFSTFMYLETFSFRKARFDRLGPAFFPRIVLVVMGILGLALLITALRDSVGSSKKQRAGRLPVQVIATFAMFGVYVMILPSLGFVFSTTLFVVGFQQLLKPTRWTRLPFQLLVTVVISYGLNYVFLNFFNVFLPEGFWS